jgi:hypothetical protein
LPGFDDEGVLILDTEAQLFKSGHFDIGAENINVRPSGKGISSLFGYRKLDPPPKSLWKSK